MTAALITYPTAPTARRNPANSRRNAPSRGASGSGGVARCANCGRILEGKHKMTCSPSCKSQLSRRKHRACAWAMVEEYKYSIQTAERVLTACGLPEVERVMNMAGWHWQPDQRAWVKVKEEAA